MAAADVLTASDTPAPRPIRAFNGAGYLLTRWLFLRALGLVYFVAFLSLSTQLDGLIGSNGLLPAATLLERISANLGVERYWTFPTLAWISASDAFLRFLGLGGVALSLLVVFGVLTAPALALLWLFYLSLVTIGQDFLSFQWDILLLETGFLAIFLAPLQLLPRLARESPPSLVVIWLFRWLIFRLMLESGLAKLVSGDPTWRNLTAMQYHYETQPLPTPLAWYVHQLPHWFARLSAASVFVVELAVPFLFFAPRRLRVIGAALTIFLQLFILLTGNYTFFNILAIVLCIPLLDDAFLRRLVPGRLVNRFAAHEMSARWARVRSALLVPLVAVVLFGTALPLLLMVGGRGLVPRPALSALGVLAPFHLVTRYGLFAVMTTTRPEIVVEGSEDGVTWRAYEFRYKPGDVRRTPPWVAPHQPRLDWQMWFAALGNYRQNPWFVSFMLRLLQGSPEVLKLLLSNPFPDAPPRYVRAWLYDYRFTDRTTRRASGAWWERQQAAPYFPTVSLEDFEGNR